MENVIGDWSLTRILQEPGPPDLFLTIPGLDQKIGVHKLVMSACSPLLKSCLLESEEIEEIYLPEYPAKIFSFLVELMYNGVASTNTDEDRLSFLSLLQSMGINSVNVELSVNQKSASLDLEKSTNLGEKIDLLVNNADIAAYVSEGLTSIYTISPADQQCCDLETGTEEQQDSFSKPDSLLKVDYVSLPSEFTCDICSGKFASEHALNLHKASHNQGTFECEYCQKTFPVFSMLRHHMKNHTKPYRCEICGVGFGKKGNLIAHERVHRGERPFVCDLCGKDFPVQSSLDTHVKQSHSVTAKKWSCEVCSQCFVSRSQLAIHHRKHTKEKPWICDTCGKRFATKQNMQDHSRLHSDVMLFQCTKCGARFKWKQSLTRHMMDHTGERPHPCAQCTMSFKTSNGLKKHNMSVHSGIKHHVCQFCQTGFSTSSGMFRHQRKQRCASLKSDQQQRAQKQEPDRSRAQQKLTLIYRPRAPEEEVEGQGKPELISLLVNPVNTDLESTKVNVTLPESTAEGNTLQLVASTESKPQIFETNLQFQ